MFLIKKYKWLINFVLKTSRNLLRLEKPQIDVRDKGFKNLQPLSQALAIVSKKLISLDTETLELRKISNHSLKILAEDVRASYSVPNFTRSTMDGYAVRSEDLLSASEDNNVVLDVIEELTIKTVSSQVLQKNQAIKIPTGGVVPDGADTIIKIEDVEILSNIIPYKISIKLPFEKGGHLSYKGEDYVKGDVIFRKGRLLSPVDIGVLLSTGISLIKCFKLPKIGIVATGDEIVDEARELHPGEVFDSNSYVLQQYVTSLGIPATRYKVIKDDYDVFKEEIQSIIEENDFIITIGGTSVGPKDFTPLILSEFSDVLIHGIAIKPGSPTTFGIRNGKYFLGLPGFPVSSLISFAFFGLPILLNLLGGQNISFFKTKAIMTQDFNSEKGKTGFLRVSLDMNSEKVLANPIMVGGSSLLHTLSKAVGIVAIDGNREKVAKDEIVEIIFIDKLVNNPQI